MASIYESPGQQVALTGSQTSPSFQQVQAYDPSRMMLAQSEKDLEALASFSETLNKVLVKEAEAKIKRQTASGFTKFVTGQVSLDPQQTQQTRDQSKLIQTAALNASQTANAAEQIPGQEGMAAQIRRTSPALRGAEVLGASIAAAQAAPSSFLSYANQAMAEGRVITDPSTGGQIKLSKSMTRTELDRAVQALTGLWGEETGYNRINPQVMMDYGGANLAIARTKFTEEIGKELDENTKEELLIKNRVNSSQILNGIIDSNTAQTASLALENSLIGTTKERNEQFKDNLAQHIDSLLVNNELAQANTILQNLGDQPHPSGVGTYRQYHAATFTALQEKVQQSGASRQKAVMAERLGQFMTEAKAYDQLAPAKRQQQIDDLAKRMRGAGMEEEDITKAVSGGSTPFEVTLLEGLRNGRLIGGKNGYTKVTIKQLEANGVIDPVVAARALQTPNLPEGDRTVEKDFGQIKDLVVSLVSQDQTKEFTVSDQTNATMQHQAKIVRELAIAQAVQKYKPVLQAAIEAGQPLQINKTSADIAGLALSYLNDRNSNLYWDVDDRSAPNIDKLINLTPNLDALFTTLIPKNTIDAIINKAMSGIVIPQASVSIPQSMFDAAQQAVNTGGPIPTSIARIAKAAGYPNANDFLAKQAVDNGYNPWKPNETQQQYLANVRQINPALAQKLNTDLTPSDRKAVLAQIKALENARQLSTQAAATTTVSGGALSVLQQDIVQRESGGDYGQYNFGVARSGPGSPALMNLKVRDVIRGDFSIDGQRVIHYGAYQFKPSTLKAVVEKAGISLDAPFNQATQDKAFQALVVGGALPWRQNLNDYVSGKVADTTQNQAKAMADLSTEWTSAQNIPPVKLGQILKNIRNEQTSTVDPNLSAQPGPARTVEVGKTLLARGIKIWQHPNFDLDKGFISGGARVGTHSAKSFHNVNQALDLPLSHNSPTQLDDTYDYLMKNAQALGISEIYWDRKGYYRDGQMIGGPRSRAIPGHDTHLHVSFK
jgi:hypothetical protein